MAEIRWTGDGYRRLKKMGDIIGPQLERRLQIVDRMLQSEININLSGRVLNRRSGDLFRSWQNKSIKRIAGGMRLTKKSSLPYTRIHELGGMAGRGRSVRIPARPYIRPAIERNISRIVSQLGDALKQVVRRT